MFCIRASKFFKDCIDCQDRHVGCHAKCPKYQANRKEWYKVNNAMRDSEKGTKKSAQTYTFQNRRGKYITKIIHVSKA